MNRYALKFAQWATIKPFLPVQATGRPAKLGDRQILDALIWKVKTGVSWRDLHDQFGPWKTIYNRFKNWSINSLWRRIFEGLAFTKAEVDSIIDGSIVRAHQVASGGKGGPKNEIGRSRKGFTTKIHAIVDSRRRPRYIEISPGQNYDMSRAENLLSKVRGKRIRSSPASTWLVWLFFLFRDDP